MMNPKNAATLNQMEESQPSALTVAQQILWIAHQQGKQLTSMQLLKLVYISHGWMLGLYNRPLFQDEIEAWRYGPVVRSVYAEYKRFGARPISDDVQNQQKYFDDYALNVMEQVVEVYGGYSGLMLSSLCHQPDSPWEITIKQMGENSVIQNDLIEYYYIMRIRSK